MNSKRVSEFMTREIREPKTYTNRSGKIVAYPQNDVRELAEIMKDIRIECMPVLSSPWKKELVGFIEFNKIRVFLNE